MFSSQLKRYREGSRDQSQETNNINTPSPSPPTTSQRIQKSGRRSPVSRNHPPPQAFINTTPRKLVPIISREEAMNLQHQNALSRAAHADFDKIVDEESDDDFVDAEEDLAQYDRRDEIAEQARAQRREERLSAGSAFPGAQEDVEMDGLDYQQNGVEFAEPSAIDDNDVSALFPAYEPMQQSQDFEELGMFSYQAQQTTQPNAGFDAPTQQHDEMEVEDESEDHEEEEAAHEQAQPNTSPNGQSAASSDAEAQDNNMEEGEADSDSDIEIIGENEQALAQSLKAQGYTYSTNRLATPPLPVPSSKQSKGPTPPPHVLEGETYSVNKTSASTASERNAQLALVASSDQPVVPRDISSDLAKYYAVHNAATYLIPRLPNFNTMDWTRRYWIAVLLMDSNRKPVKKLGEKDFIWMKGNKNSTVSTVWHAYQTRTLAQDFVLVCRSEVCGMEMRAEELDWFGKKLVVFKAISAEDAEDVAEGLSKGVGAIPSGSEVIELLDD